MPRTVRHWLPATFTDDNNGEKKAHGPGHILDGNAVDG